MSTLGFNVGRWWLYLWAGSWAWLPRGCPQPDGVGDRAPGSGCDAHAFALYWGPFGLELDAAQDDDAIFEPPPARPHRTIEVTVHATRRKGVPHVRFDP